jgi:hypothetical protein
MGGSGRGKPRPYGHFCCSGAACCATTWRRVS